MSKYEFSNNLSKWVGTRISTNPRWKCCLHFLWASPSPSVSPPVSIFSSISFSVSSLYLSVYLYLHLSLFLCLFISVSIISPLPGSVSLENLTDMGSCLQCLRLGVRRWYVAGEKSSPLPIPVTEELNKQGPPIFRAERYEGEGEGQTPTFSRQCIDTTSRALR